MEKILYDDDIRDATRLHNRALRTVNKSLRKQAEIAKQQTDEIVAALFDAPAPISAAEEALRRIWEKLDGKILCGPDDYEAIANTVIQAMTD